MNNQLEVLFNNFNLVEIFLFSDLILLKTLIDLYPFNCAAAAFLCKLCEVNQVVAWL